jgi:uncharacterized protein (DUF305 family)
MTARMWVMLAIVGVVALGAGVGVGAAVWAGGDHDDSPTVSSGGHGGESGTEMDERSFMEQMVPHHRSAIEMATLALEKGQHPEVRRLARSIVQAQQREIEEMEVWHRDWFGQELQPSESGLHASIDMGALEDAEGADFDRAFLRMMIPHHASAIVMAESVMMGSPREEIAELADEIVAAQAKEIGQMQEWRERWFPPLG